MILHTWLPIRVHSHTTQLQDIVHFQFALFDVGRHGAVQKDVVEQVEVILFILREMLGSFAIALEQLSEDEASKGGRRRENMRQTEISSNGDVSHVNEDKTRREPNHDTHRAFVYIVAETCDKLLSREQTRGILRDPCCDLGDFLTLLTLTKTLIDVVGHSLHLGLCLDQALQIAICIDLGLLGALDILDERLEQEKVSGDPLDRGDHESLQFAL